MTCIFCKNEEQDGSDFCKTCINYYKPLWKKIRKAHSQYVDLFHKLERMTDLLPNSNEECHCSDEAETITVWGDYDGGVYEDKCVICGDTGSLITFN